MVTTVKTNNKVYETIGLGEINTLKDIGLRNIEMKILLPNDLSLPFVQKKYMPSCILDKPIRYLSQFRLFKSEKKPINLIIGRTLPNGEEIFRGDIFVSLENFSVTENAGEEGDFWVNLEFKEYKKILETNMTKLNDTSQQFYLTTNRTQKQKPKVYVVKPGDTLWNIAKTQLNDATLYKKIMQINNISNPKKLKVGTELILEQ